MKKLFALILAITMLAAMSVTAFAAEIDQDTAAPKEGETLVSFNVDPTYTVTIPATVTLEKQEADGVVTYENDYTITADAGVRLKKNEYIEVTVASDFEMTTTEGATLTYAITADGNEIANNGVVAEFDTDKQMQTSVIHIAANDPDFAGNYSDTVTFTIAVVSAPSAPATISFTIDGVTYQAEEGMTWAQWAVSSYNNDGEHFLSEYGWIGHVGGGGLLEDANSVITDGYETYCRG